MNIKSFLLTTAAAATLAACSDYDPGLSEGAVNLTEAEEQLVNEYTANFIDRYGEIDPNHSWGFGEMTPVNEQDTRTQVQVNRNQWITLNKDNQDDRNLTSITYENVGGSTVPGFPSSVDGLYHIWTDNGASENYTTAHEAISYAELAQRVKNSTDEVVPVGDVTDEEILYVSTWFRTHQNPISEPLNVDKFYVQAISKDYDRQSYQDVTAAEKAGTAPAWYETQTGPYLEKLPIKYFLNGVETQYDYSGNVKEPNATSDFVTYSLDWLAVQKAEGEEFEHINNFNANNTAKISSTNPTGSNSDYSSAVNAGIDGTSYRMMEYVYETGTHDFEVHSSNVDEMEHRWVLKHLTFTGRDGKNYDGWYLAFDIAFTKAQETQVSYHGDYDFYLKTRDEDGNIVEGIEGTWQKMAYRDYDGYYSNYIVKIIPGDGGAAPVPNNNYCRIMCEDLGNTDDFDFNDLVFDIYYTGEAAPYTAHVTLQAAGGTLPLYIGQKDSDHEVHRLFGYNPQANGTYLPINVGTGTSAAPKEITFTTQTTNPDDIKIYVTTKTGDTESGTSNRLTLLPEAGETSTLNIATQKICIPGNTTKWTTERTQIENAYPYFDEWVQEENGDYNFDGATPWNTTDVNNQYLVK